MNMAGGITMSQKGAYHSYWSLSMVTHCRLLMYQLDHGMGAGQPPSTIARAIISQGYAGSWWVCVCVAISECHL